MTNPSSVFRRHRRLFAWEFGLAVGVAFVAAVLSTIADFATKDTHFSALAAEFPGVLSAALSAIGGLSVGVSVWPLVQFYRATSRARLHTAHHLRGKSDPDDAAPSPGEHYQALLERFRKHERMTEDERRAEDPSFVPPAEQNTPLPRSIAERINQDQDFEVRLLREPTFWYEHCDPDRTESMTLEDVGAILEMVRKRIGALKIEKADIELKDLTRKIEEIKGHLT